MNTSLWIVIAVVAAFVGFIVGYSVPPMMEVAIMGGAGEGGKVAAKAEEGKKIEDYYRSLYEAK